MAAYRAFPLLSLSQRNARAIGKQSGRDVHSLKLLEKQLGCIGDVDLRNLGLVLARPTLERLLG